MTPDEKFVIVAELLRFSAIAFYLSIALLDCSVDAAICWACKRKFNPVLSILAAALWPLVLPIQIGVFYALCRDYPKWSERP